MIAFGFDGIPKEAVGELTERHLEGTRSWYQAVASATGGQEDASPSRGMTVEFSSFRDHDTARTMTVLVPGDKDIRPLFVIREDGSGFLAACEIP